MKFILGKKLKMAQIFDKEGNQIPVTLIEAGPCEVLQIKKKEKDGYEAVQIGFERLKEKKITKTKKKKPYKYLREFRVENSEINNYKIGQKIDVSIFKEGELISVSGISKGKGFAGGVKRWGFAGRPATHGTKHEERTIGSVGSSTPAHVVKGRKMPGRAGGKRVTIKNLEIVKIDKEKNLLAIKGAVPGTKGTLLEIKSSK
jgi:large subunit ribosomal protein L3